MEGISVIRHHAAPSAARMSGRSAQNFKYLGGSRTPPCHMLTQIDIETGLLALSVEGGTDHDKNYAPSMATVTCNGVHHAARRQARMRRSALISLIVLTACMLPPCQARSATQTPSLAPYQAQLFNLLMNRRSPVDGKNHYDRKFDQVFDALLAQSSMAKASAVPLKRRLLSGPQPEPDIVDDKVANTVYLYDEACQAHACADTSLALVYAPASGRMAGRLLVDGKQAYLGKPTAAEIDLLKPR